MSSVAGADIDTESWVHTLLRDPDPSALALADRTTELSYGELRERIAIRLAELALGPRSLVVLDGERSVDYVVTYLALLAGRHVPILAGGHGARLAEAWRPAATVRADAGGWTLERHEHPAHALHPELALLLSTSGSTGSPKLVRLSATNLATNAVAVAESLGLTAADRAITALPLHYCYGLSVLHSHLAVGAGVVIETASVVDPCFAAALDRHHVTNVATVAHMLELLEHGDPERLRGPAVRLITQAGGRLDPALGSRWRERSAAWGVDFVSMYGQTEATARMAYLPPALAQRQPGTIGVPVPGGELRVEPLAELPDGVPAGTGEIVYRGPNVMMGYGLTAADLERGPELSELRTGDLAHVDPASGAITIVGRAARFVKPFGVRIDLDQIERELVVAGFGRPGEVAAAGDDAGIAIAAAAAPAAVQSHLAAFSGLPVHRIGVVAAVPRTSAGKVDYPALLAAARRTASPAESHRHSEGGVAHALAAVLGVEHVPGDATFVSLGGDSLSYIEAAVRLEPVLGRLPADWHLTPVAELEARAASADGNRRSRRWVRWTDTTAVLRAVGVAAVVLTHMRWAYFPGGAHIMLGVVAYNLSRFLLPVDSAAERCRLAGRTAARVAVPAVLWVALGMVFFGAYSTGTLLLVNNYVGPPTHRDDHWHFWFIEVFVHLIVLLTAALAIPAVRRFERRWQYLLPLALVGLGVLLRQEWAQDGDWYILRFRTHGAFLFFALGWLVQRSVTIRQKLLTGAVVVATVYDTFGVPRREVFIAVSLIVLLWCREVPLPRPLAWALAGLGSASLWVLITHFTVYPWMMERLPIGWAYAATLCVGVMVWWLVERVERAALARWRRRGTGNLLVPGWSVA